jgi:protoporphyrinogen oxidase
VTAQEVEKLGGRIIKNARVTKIHKKSDNTLDSITYVDANDGSEHVVEGDIVISSMPIKDLVGGMNDVPEEEARIAAGLPYRDYMTLGVLVPRLKLKNLTDMKTVNGIIPDCWVYVQDRKVKLGRFQIYNNWSPYMIKDLEHTVWIGLEYFVNEGDEYWNMSEEEFSKFCAKEMVKLGLISKTSDVLDTHMEKVKKAYPAYFDGYSHMNDIIKYLDKYDNLFCIGRNGQHRYNNMDHSMATAIEAVALIRKESTDKRALWSVNTEAAYHEKK